MDRRKKSKSDPRVGDIYGDLELIKDLGLVQTKNQKCRSWLTRCLCGNEKEALQANIVRGDTTSCGCKKRGSQPGPGFVVEAKSIYRNYLNGAQRRNIEFKLSFNEFYEIILMKCHYCGSPPNNSFNRRYSTGKNKNKPTKKEPFFYSGIDRVQNDRGYEKGNVVPACVDCNYSKRVRSVESFLDWNRSFYLHSNFQNDIELLRSLIAAHDAQASLPPPPGDSP